MTTPEALVELRTKLKKWNREVFGDIHKRKEDLLSKIKEIQNLLDSSQTDDLLSQEEVLIQDLDRVLEQEEILWLQKSRERWIVEGDRNTSLFHISTVIRRRRNRIESLKNDAGEWVSNPQELEQIATAYYKRLYSLDDVDQVVDKLPPNGFHRITQNE